MDHDDADHAADDGVAFAPHTPWSAPPGPARAAPRADPAAPPRADPPRADPPPASAQRAPRADPPATGSTSQRVPRPTPTWAQKRFFVPVGLAPDAETGRHAPSAAEPPPPTTPATPPVAPLAPVPPSQPTRPDASPRRPARPYPDAWAALGYTAPTAEEFARRRAIQPREWVATTGIRGAARRGSFGLIRLRPSQREQEDREALDKVRRAFGGLRQITVVNPKGGAGKTVATLMLGLTFGQARGGFVLTWDNNETQGTLGMRAQPDTHARTVRDLLRDLERFTHSDSRIGELASYVRSQEAAMFDVLASDEAATAGEMLTARAFREIRAVVGRFYKLILVDTGNNVRAENWQAAVDATDQLLITMSARNDSAETAARLLDHLEQTGRRELVRRAVVVMTMPPHRKDVNPRPIEQHFDARCRIVLRVPYDKHLDSGSPVRYPAVSAESRRAWLRVAAAIADGL